MKCIYCKKGTMKFEYYQKPKRSAYHTKDKAKLVCDNCGHKEVFA